MTTVTINGASDDLIEVAGAIEEEFPYQQRGHGQPSGNLLAFSDGTILRIEFNHEGVWRIQPVQRGTAWLGIEPAPEGDEGNYSDVATLTGDVWWVVQGMGYAIAPGGSS